MKGSKSKAKKDKKLEEVFPKFKFELIKDYRDYLEYLESKYTKAFEEGYQEAKELDPMVICKFIHKNIMKDLYRTGKCTGYRKYLLEYLRGLSREQRLQFRDKVAESTSYKNSVQSINYIIKDLDIEEGIRAPKRDYIWSKIRAERKATK